MNQFEGLSIIADSTTPQSTGIGCSSCVHLAPCGGYPARYDCLDQCICSNPKICVYICPNSAFYSAAIREIGGLDASRSWVILNRNEQKLPLYIPKIHHGYVRQKQLEWPFVAISTYSVTPRTTATGDMFETGEQLRAKFHLSPSAQIVLVSADTDAKLARFWHERRPRDLAKKIAQLGVVYITAPNFSFPLNSPRTEHLGNKKRSLICAEEFSLAGLNVIPHLNAVHRSDWEFWLSFLREHSEINMVCKEFQTGLANPAIAKWHIEHLFRLEQALGRGLHIIAIAGRRYLGYLRNLHGVTIIDSQPFMGTFYRRKLNQSDGQWIEVLTNRRRAMDALLLHNISAYNASLSSIDRSTQLNLELEPLPDAPADPIISVPTDQLSLFPPFLEAII